MTCAVFATPTASGQRKAGCAPTDAGSVCAPGFVTLYVTVSVSPASEYAIANTNANG
jgi:hypothetical protein